MHRTGLDHSLGYNIEKQTRILIFFKAPRYILGYITNLCSTPRHMNIAVVYRMDVCVSSQRQLIRAQLRIGLKAHIVQSVCRPNRITRNCLQTFVVLQVIIVPWLIVYWIDQQFTSEGKKFVVAGYGANKYYHSFFIRCVAVGLTIFDRCSRGLNNVNIKLNVFVGNGFVLSLGHSSETIHKLYKVLFNKPRLFIWSPTSDRKCFATLYKI